MKWLIYLAILGVVEVAVIGKLHEVLGFYKLIGLYLVTTIIGAVFLLVQLPAFRQALKFMRKLEKGSIKKFKRPDYQPTADDIEEMRPLLFFTLYAFAAVHIIIPGIVTDFIGMLLIVPFISNAYINHKIDKMIQKASRGA